ncbi:hypothetical protein QTO34_020204 [Cnephaeus nilssonii]|uniref:Uncharacterized protein n=1 Tax=Cnephaeus nilssonii TaxID=3371016 RepID=A0AA40HY56_CNENI|nr:hypothetical protein QTO34_020204 [Eptesicus nilssonii]
MSSGKHLLGGAPGKKPGPTLSQEHGLPAALPSRPNVQAQPSAQSSNQQALETQDWLQAVRLPLLGTWEGPLRPGETCFTPHSAPPWGHLCPPPPHPAAQFPHSSCRQSGREQRKPDAPEFRRVPVCQGQSLDKPGAHGAWGSEWGPGRAEFPDKSAQMLAWSRQA